MSEPLSKEPEQQLLGLEDAGPPETLDDLIMLSEGLAEKLQETLHRVWWRLLKTPGFMGENPRLRDTLITRVVESRDKTTEGLGFLKELNTLAKVRREKQRAELPARITNLRDEAQKALNRGDRGAAADFSQQADTLSNVLKGVGHG